MLLDNGACERDSYVVFGAGFHDNKLAAESVRSGLQVRYLRLADLICWICKHCDDAGGEYQFQQKPEPLRGYLAAE